MGFWVLGLGVKNVGFAMQGLVWGLGFGVWRVGGWGCGVWGCGGWGLGFLEGGYVSMSKVRWRADRWPCGVCRVEDAVLRYLNRKSGGGSEGL